MYPITFERISLDIVVADSYQFRYIRNLRRFQNYLNYEMNKFVPMDEKNLFPMTVIAFLHVHSFSSFYAILIFHIRRISSKTC